MFLFFSQIPLSVCYWFVDFDTTILPICKDSLGWMFNNLDMNFDLLLDLSELSAVHLDKNELRMKPLLNSWDCCQKPEGEGGGRVFKSLTERIMKSLGVEEMRGAFKRGRN